MDTKYNNLLKYSICMHNNKIPNSIYNDAHII